MVLQHMAKESVRTSVLFEFKAYVDDGFLPQDVFNCDETGHFLKKMPKRRYYADEKALARQKPIKKKLNLFCEVMLQAIVKWSPYLCIQKLLGVFFAETM